jgi:hypothetical protein
MVKSRKGTLIRKAKKRRAEVLTMSSKIIQGRGPEALPSRSLAQTVVWGIIISGLISKGLFNEKVIAARR